MKKIFTLAALAFAMVVPVSCSQDDSNGTDDPQGSDMVGPQFDLLIGQSLDVNGNNQWATVETYIVNPTNGVPLFNNGFPQYVIPNVYWVAEQIQRGADQAVVVANSTMLVRLTDLPQEFTISLYQYEPPFFVGENEYPYQHEMFINTIDQYEVGHPKVTYSIPTENLQPSDCIEFHVGEHAEVTTYKVHRNLNLNASTPLTDATVVASGNANQL